MRKLLFALLACSGLVYGQVPAASAPATKGPATVENQFLSDFAITRGFTLGRPVRIQPTPDGKAVLYLRSEGRSSSMRLYEFDVATGSAREILSPDRLLKGSEEKLSPEEKAQRERQRVSTRGITNYQLSEDGNLILVSLSGRLFVYTRANRSVRELSVGPGTILDPKFSPDGTQVSYVNDADIYTFELATFQKRRITTGGSADLSNGLAEFVAQEEMGRFAGYWWSPDSRFIAYQQSDARAVEVWQPADPAKPEPTEYTQRYPRPGKNNVKVRLGVTPATGGETTWLDWNSDRYPYLATVKWDKGGPLTLVVQTRLQRELAVLTADETGKTKLLFTESDPMWVNLDQEVPRWLSDGSGFLWTSERDGAPQLELRDPKGALLRVLVPPGTGYVPDKSNLSVDEKARLVYFRAGDDPTSTQLFRVSLDGGEPVALTSKPGQHTFARSKDQGVYVVSATDPQNMMRSSVYRADGTLVGKLPSDAVEPPFKPNVEFVKVGPGTGYHCSLVRPRNFDPRRRYPVIVQVYGGPGAQQVVASMGSYLRTQWLADQGYIVVSIDNRGTPRRGRAWERAIVGSFGTVPLDGQVAGLQALAKRFPELDTGRVGITGWSFGGYMSALAVLRRPDIFKAAVAGAPVADWLDYDTHYTERYLGLPAENARGYKESSLLTYAPELERPLLLVHGTSDDNVFFLHTLKLSDALFRAGKEHEVLPLSGLTHMVPDPEVRIRLEERIAAFFRKNL